MTTAAGSPLAVRLPDERRPSAGARGVAMVRPEHVRLAPLGPAAAAGTEDGSWRCPAKVVSRGYFGAYARYWLELDGVPEPWLADVPVSESGDEARQALAPGTAATVSVGAGAACWLW